MTFIELSHGHYHYPCGCGEQARYRLTLGQIMTFYCEDCAITKLWRTLE